VNRTDAAINNTCFAHSIDEPDAHVIIIKITRFYSSLRKENVPAL